MPALPTECVLRPATAADRPRIQHLLTNLEQETRSEVAASWLGKGVGFGLLGLVGIYALIVPGGIRSLLRFLLLPLLLLALGLTLLNLTQQREWRQYWVIEANGHLVACAKLQRQGSYSVLYDLYVVPDWRKRGLGSHLVSYLGQQATRPLYLACLPARLGFYRRLGFTPIAPKQLPGLLQYDLGLPTRPGIIPLVLT